MLLPKLNSHTNNYFNRTCQNPTKVHFHQPNRLHLPNGPINTKVNTTKSRDNTLCQVSNFYLRKCSSFSVQTLPKAQQTRELSVFSKVNAKAKQKQQAYETRPKSKFWPNNDNLLPNCENVNHCCAKFGALLQELEYVWGNFQPDWNGGFESGGKSGVQRQPGSPRAPRKSLIPH